MTQTNPDQWAVELWRKACHDYGGMSIEGGWGEQAAALAIQAAFAEREARLVGVLESAEQAATVKENLTVQTEGKRNTARRWQSCKLRTKAK